MKNRTFRQLNQGDRDRIELLYNKGALQKDIACILKVGASAVSREITNRKKADGSYDAMRAQEKAMVLRSNSKYQGMKIEKYPNLKQHIIEQLKNHRSPDEIAGRLKRNKIIPRASKDAIYKWLYSSYGAKYCKHLCTQRTKPKPQKNKTGRSLIPNAVSIHKRPKRGRHAEADTFVSPRRVTDPTVIAVTILQKEKYITMQKIPNRKPESMCDAMVHARKRVSFDTLTLDRGIENRHHEQFTMPSYFCDPHSPWQKPHVEGVIGLARRWFVPKGTDLSKLSDEQLAQYVSILNKKYRKSLRYESAEEVVRRSGIINPLAT